MPRVANAADPDDDDAPGGSEEETQSAVEVMSAPPGDDPDWDDIDEEDEMSLADELGVEDLTDILFADRGKIFSAAGRQSPIAEFGEDGVLLRPPQLPYLEGAVGEEIVYQTNEHGILLNELGEPRRIFGAKFRDKPIYVIGEQKPGTVKHYAAWFDAEWKAHKFYVQGDALTSDMVYRIRNRTHDGEISVFPEIQTD